MSLLHVSNNCNNYVWPLLLEGEPGNKVSRVQCLSIIDHIMLYENVDSLPPLNKDSLASGAPAGM